MVHDIMRMLNWFILLCWYMSYMYKPTHLMHAHILTYFSAWPRHIIFYLIYCDYKQSVSLSDSASLHLHSNAHKYPSFLITSVYYHTGGVVLKSLS